jgi:4-hydroxy-tetrahydrodipicolinate synthase
MVRQSLQGDFAKAKKMNDELMDAYELMFAENNPAGVKAFMTEHGLLKNNLRLPMVPLSAGLHEKVKAYLSKSLFPGIIPRACVVRVSLTRRWYRGDPSI